jgi:hypothetical protein
LPLSDRGKTPIAGRPLERRYGLAKMQAPAAHHGAPIRIVLADHAAVRRNLQLLLEDEDGFEVVASLGDVKAAIRTTGGHSPTSVCLTSTCRQTGLKANPVLRSTWW